ncbi:MAG TPA: hypothetical protein VNH44_07295 [Micropepsaceae bacterium]|nr:hypothetical protein [Micropepsaceae bacterium]
MATLRSSGGREVLIEIVTMGAYAKVTAIDSATGTEVSITAPSNAPRASLESAAISKLEFVLKKKAGPQSR